MNTNNIVFLISMPSFEKSTIGVVLAKSLDILLSIHSLVIQEKEHMLLLLKSFAKRTGWL